MNQLTPSDLSTPPGPKQRILPFSFYPLRFEFVARETLTFPRGQAANIMRGAFGLAFRRLACVPDCPGAVTCEIRQTCPYARVFEPCAAEAGPSGLADWPRPFVFRARHLDGRTFKPGEEFHFDLNLFMAGTHVRGYLNRTFADLANEGFGPKRAKAEPLRFPSEPIQPVVLDLVPAPTPLHYIRVEFLTPTELKHEGKIAARPEFPILFSRIRDRIATLARLYNGSLLAFDFQASNDAAAAIAMTSFNATRHEYRRRSTRTNQVHMIGGFTGHAEYKGDLGQFVPFLEAAQYVGVGRQAVWGKGELLVRRSV